MPDKPPENGPDQVYLTVRQMVAEIRIDVKELRAEATRLAAIPDVTKDHETRLRRVEIWAYGIPLTGFLAIGGLITAVVTH